MVQNPTHVRMETKSNGIGRPTFPKWTPLVFAQMVWSIKGWQHPLQCATQITKVKHGLIVNKTNELQKTQLIAGCRKIGPTTNLRLLCIGKRAFLKYWGVSRYCNIRMRKAALLSSSELSTTESLSGLPLLSNTTTYIHTQITVIYISDKWTLEKNKGKKITIPLIKNNE